MCKNINERDVILRENDNKHTFDIELSDQLNRSVTIDTMINNIPMHVGILFNKRSSFLQFKICKSKSYYEDRDIHITMFRQLSNSVFCKSFLFLENRTEGNIDYQNKFNGIKRNFKSEVFKFMAEKYDLKIRDNRKSNNYLLMLGFKLNGYEHDLNYFFIQRRCYNNVTNLNIIRTIGMQIANTKGLECMDKYKNYIEQNIPEKANGVDFLGEIAKNKTDTLSRIFRDDQ